MGRFQRATAAAVLEGEKSLTFELAVPEKAKRNRKEPRDARWTANVQITEVSSEETTSQKGDDHLLLIVTGEIMDGLEDDGSNKGRLVSMRARLNYAAFNEGDKKNKQYKMHNRTMGMLSQLLRATNMYGGGDIEEELLETAFPEQGASPLVGNQVGAEIHQGPNDDGKVFPEISAWLVDDGAGGTSLGTSSSASTSTQAPAGVSL